MNEAEKRANEVGFWKDLFERDGLEAFLERRKADLAKRLTIFPELINETGKGLDYGCGLVSIFEFIEGKYIYACDPLLEEYDKIYRHPGTVHYMNDLGQFDYIVCYNVIDHTLDPQTIIEDFKKHLKPGGRIYFEVNFDREIYAPHFTLWNQAVVDMYMRDFELGRSSVTKNIDQPNEYPQYNYVGVYIKEPGALGDS